MSNISTQFPTSSDSDSDLAEARTQLSAERIHIADIQEVQRLKKLIGRGDTPGLWRTAPNSRRMRYTDIDLRNSILRRTTLAFRDLISEPKVGLTRLQVNGAGALSRYVKASHRAMAESILQRATESLERYALVCTLGPSGLGRKNGTPLPPKSIARLAAQEWSIYAAKAVEKQFAEWLQDEVYDQSSSATFSFLYSSELFGDTPSSKNRALNELARFSNLQQRGFWTDIPKNHNILESVTPVKGELRRATEVKPPKRWQPLPDTFVAEMGWKSLWIINELGPNILRILSEASDILAALDKRRLARGTHSHLFRSMFRDHILRFRWTLLDGTALTQLPFPVFLRRVAPVGIDGFDDGVAGDDTGATWPPTHPCQIWSLVALVQSAHLYVVGFSSASRQVELLDWDRDCLILRRDGLSAVRGRTTKLENSPNGRIRDWILPEVAVHAITQQQQLLNSIERGVRTSQKVPNGLSAPTHLWISLGSKGEGLYSEPLRGLNYTFMQYAASLGMSANPGGSNFHPHRLRKTLARLCGLALTQSPKILMDVFGHKDISMTIYYIMSDEAFADEVKKVARELRVMMAKDAVASIFAEERAADEDAVRSAAVQLGGPAAISIGRAVSIHRSNVHRRGEEWGAKSQIELAEILTLNGSCWTYVRKGVICTKTPGSAAPCTKRVGEPDSSNCQMTCAHRLEEAFLRKDVKETVLQLAADIKEARKNNALMTEAHLIAQLKENTDRFPDLKDELFNELEMYDAPFRQ